MKFRAAELMAECFYRHIQEHIGIPMDTSQMSQNELLFHFFKMHDADNNSKLDGCEMIKYTIHAHGKSIR